MSRIRLLSEATVNRIAAGEVIERPAAAAKELVENALDAGATRIAVSLEGGGIERLEVTDNGCGMTAVELALCVQRHATSKLADESLVRIATLGFRGEALPSIGAAARLRITSRPSDARPATIPSAVSPATVPATAAAVPLASADGRERMDADHAHALTVEGGAVSTVMPAAGAPGTTVAVRDLFFATPARRKFLKNPRTEASHVEAVVRRLALSAPAVAFRLDSDGRAVFAVPAQRRIERVAALLGTEAAEALLPVDEERLGMHIGGYVCSPSVHRITPAGQVLIVNGRPVADPVLRTAVKVAYRDVIVAGRHAVVALYLTLPGDELDVNVHPAKAELRFRDADAVRGAVIGAIRRALGQGAGTAVPRAAPPWSAQAWTRLTPRSAYGGRSFAAAVHDAAQPETLRSGTIPSGPPLVLRSADPATAPTGFGEAQLPLEAAPAARQLSGEPPSGPAAAAAHLSPVDALAYPLGAPVAQVLDTYILAVAGDGSMVLVDQHAAHERLTHEALRAQLLDDGVRSQPLLLPAVVDLPAGDVAHVLAHAVELGRLGLELEAFGPGAVLVRAVPAALGAPEPGPLLRDLAEELAELGEQTALSTRLDAVIARMACHGSIRAGRKLGTAEMSALLRRMEQTPRAATCSHGRPTVLKLSKADIERMFGRR